LLNVVAIARDRYQMFRDEYEGNIGAQVLLSYIVPAGFVLYTATILGEDRPIDRVNLLQTLDQTGLCAAARCPGDPSAAQWREWLKTGQNEYWAKFWMEKNLDSFASDPALFREAMETWKPSKK